MKKIFVAVLIALCGVSFGFGAVEDLDGPAILQPVEISCEDYEKDNCIKNNCIVENEKSRCIKTCENIAKTACER